MSLEFDKIESADDLDRSSSNSRRDKNIKPNRKWASLVTQMVKNLPAMQETWVQSLVWEDSLE